MISDRQKNQGKEQGFKSQIENVNCQNSNCQRQMTIMSNMIQYDGQNGQYYGSINCQQCKLNNYFLWCDECGVHLISKNQFYDGYFHYCTNSECRKKFQIVKCPHCERYNFYENHQYQMGKITQCIECCEHFQQVSCPKCKEDTYFDGKYQEGVPFKCSNRNCSLSQQNIQHINCPYCSFPNLFNIIQPLQVTTCQNNNYPENTCNKKFFYLPCKNCHDCLIIEGDVPLEYGKKIKCKKCNTYTSINLCNTCQHYSTQTSDKKGNYGKVTCGQQNCKRKFILLKCGGKCKYLNQIDDKNQKDIFKEACQGCQKEAFYLICPKCSAGSQLLVSDLSASRTVECPECKAYITHEIKEKINTNTLECKICMEKPATFLIDSCNHLFGCEECADQLKKNSGSSRVKCPICRSMGQIKKIYF